MNNQRQRNDQTTRIIDRCWRNRYDHEVAGNAAEIGRGDLLFEKVPDGRGGYDLWIINGRSWPATNPLFTTDGQTISLNLLPPG